MVALVGDSYDVVIAGAGFAGIACASALAERGCSVLIMERKADVGKGLHTTGILVDEAARLLALPQGICKPVSHIKLYGPSMRSIEVKSDRYIFQATDTPALMHHFVAEAEAKGVSFLFDTPFVNARACGKLLEINGGLVRCRFLIGADGAKSRVAEMFGLGRNRRFLLGVEAEYSGLELDGPDAFHCFLNRKYAPGYIGWIIPGPKVVQIGLATCRSERPDIARFFDYVSPQLKATDPKLVERRGGLIPVGGLVQPYCRDNVILTGDAAGLVSPLTAGGIHTAIYYGHRLGSLLSDHIQAGARHPKTFLQREYPRFTTKRMLRYLFDRAPNWCFEAMIASPVSYPLANAIFFLKKRLPARSDH